MALLTFFINFFTFLLLIITMTSSSSSSTELTQEAETLLKIKNTHLTDPTSILSDWLPSNKSPCNWTGIYCNSKTHSIISIDFTGFGISGHFPSGFCQISSLQNLTLSDNYFGGTISDQDISSCSHLHYLNLSMNWFVGSLPEFISGFSNLSVLDLSYNNFTGEIPSSFGRFPKLQVLFLAANLFNGTIPSFFTNLTELISLDVTLNPFAPGPLPLDIGNLTNLKYLRISYTNVIGSIPESIGNLVALKSLDLSNNYLTGSIPKSIGRLMSIEQIELFNNHISGELPESLGNLTTLVNFDASENKLTGKLPEKFAGLNLFSLGLNENNLEGEIPVSLAMNSRLFELKLFKNNFTGTIPRDLGRNSDLIFIDVSDNQLEGTIPPFLCYRKKFRSIDVFNNRFSGKFPEIYGDCKTIDYIRIFNNEFTGEFPIGLWSLPKLTIFEIRNNQFEGSIPSSIAISKNITELLISGNNFSGVFPLEICQLHKLVVVDARRNQFSGELPTCITEMKQLQTLDLQDNKFSGEIPSNADSWTDLTELGLSRNRFSGEIPSGLGDLPVLTYLDLSNNLLSGKIPMKLTNLKLNQLNLSYNLLSGPIPPGFANSFYLQSMLGNPGLCSSNLKPFLPCPEPKTISWFLVAVCLFLSLLLLFSVFWLFKSKCKSIRRKSKPLWKFTSFHMLSFKEEEIFSSLTEENLIGTGGSGKVYRARLKNGQTVAVKKLWECNGKLEMGNVFRSEVETLGSIRHGNIVKLLFVCTGEDFRVLVYDYMENGSLGDVLHVEKGGALLDWSNRFNIAVGTAQGLAYLHHDCVPSIVHRDVKSNNILLDEEFRARVADFGIAKTLLRHESDQDENLMSRIAGSYGYIAPEYAYTMKVTEKSDVYSFGVVLMELVTGKRPIDPSFGESKDIVRWVTDAASTSQEEKTDQNKVSSTTTTTTTTNLRHIVDLRLMKTSSEGDYEEMEKVLNVALLCTSKFPLNRPSMRRVVELLKDCKKNVHAITAGKVPDGLI